MKEEKHNKKKNKENIDEVASEKELDISIEEVDLEKMLAEKRKEGKKGFKIGKQEKKKNQSGKPKRKLSKRGKIVLIAIFLIILLIGGIFGYNVWKNGGGLKGTVVTVVGGKDEEKLKDLPPLQFLLLGKSDFMTDTIMVCSYDPKTQQASMLSVPRDTYIGKNSAEATASEKINSRYQLGIDKTLKAINRVTGMEIEYYVVVDTEALVKLVDQMGGVEFNVPIDMDYDDWSQELYIHLDAGLQTLNGEQAEQLLRFRHNNDGSSYSVEYGDQDLGRMRTQREFIQAAFKQFFTVSNLLNINEFINIAEESVETNMDFGVLKDYVPYAVDFNMENLITDVLPGTPELCNEVWVYIVDKEDATEMIKTLFGEEALKNTIQNGFGTKTSTTKNETNTTKNETTTSTNTTTNTTTNTVTNTPTTTKNEVANTVVDKEPEKPKNEETTTNTTTKPNTGTTNTTTDPNKGTTTTPGNANTNKVTTPTNTVN